jgi:hypothetical protein
LSILLSEFREIGPGLHYVIRCPGCWQFDPLLAPVFVSPSNQNQSRFRVVELGIKFHLVMEINTTITMQDHKSTEGEGAVNIC